MGQVHVKLALVMTLTTAENIAARILREQIRILRRLMPKRSGWRMTGSTGWFFSGSPLGGEGPTVGGEKMTLQLQRGDEVAKICCRAVTVGVSANIPWDLATIGFSDEKFPSGGLIFLPPGVEDFRNEMAFSGPCLGGLLDAAVNADVSVGYIVFGIDDSFSKRMMGVFQNLKELLAPNVELNLLGAPKRPTVQEQLRRIEDIVIDWGTTVVQLNVMRAPFRGILFMAGSAMTYSPITQANIGVSAAIRAGVTYPENIEISLENLKKALLDAEKNTRP